MKQILVLILLTLTPLTFASEKLIFETYSEEIDERELAESLQELEFQKLSSSHKSQILDRITSGVRVLSRGYNMASIGLEVYKLVLEQKPTVNTSFAPISVLPVHKGKIVSAMSLTDVSGLMGRRYTVVGKSLAGVEAVRFEYTVLFQTGHYKGGRYIINTIVKANTRVLWGNSFDAKMTYVGMANKGTAKNPVAQVTMKISYKGSSLFVSQENEVVIQIDALGRIGLY